MKKQLIEGTQANSPPKDGLSGWNAHETGDYSVISTVEIASASSDSSMSRPLIRKYTQRALELLLSKTATILPSGF